MFKKKSLYVSDDVSKYLAESNNAKLDNSNQKKARELIRFMNDKFLQPKGFYSKLKNRFIEIGSQSDKNHIHYEFKNELINSGIDNNDIFFVLNEDSYKNKIYIKYSENNKNILVNLKDVNRKMDLSNGINSYVDNLNEFLKSEFDVIDYSNEEDVKFKINNHQNFYGEEDFIISLENLSADNIDIIAEILCGTKAFDFGDFNFKTVDTYDYSMEMNFSNIKLSKEELAIFLIELNNQLKQDISKSKSKEKKDRLLLDDIIDTPTKAFLNYISENRLANKDKDIGR